jgi:hypothetical protein
MSTRSEASKCKPVCQTCGSDNVRLDAWAEWNLDTQRWELSQTFDAAYCDRCECHKSHLEWIPAG